MNLGSAVQWLKDCPLQLSEMSFLYKKPHLHLRGRGRKLYLLTGKVLFAGEKELDLACRSFQGGDGLCVIGCAENRRSRDQNIRSRPGDGRNVLRIDPAVHFQ